MKRMMQVIVLSGLVLCSSMAFAQYEEEPYMEGSVGPNMTVPMGYIKNDLVPDSLNAKAGIGLDVSAGYYLSPKMVLGLYFNLRNMGTEELELNHRVFEFGAYGKYFMMELTDRSFSPYIRVAAGVNFSKLVTPVVGDGVGLFRELSHDPTLGLSGALGLHVKTNEFGAVYLEGAYHFDLMDSVTGDFKGVDYEWGDNNQFVVIKAGVLFNIGPGD